MSSVSLKELLRRTLLRISGKENVDAQSYLDAFREEAKMAGITLEEKSNITEHIKKLKPTLQTLIKKYPIKNQEELISALTSLLNNANQLNDKVLLAQKELTKALLRTLAYSQDKNFATLANTQLNHIDKATPTVLAQWNQKWNEILEQKKRHPTPAPQNISQEKLPLNTPEDIKTIWKNLINFNFNQPQKDIKYKQKLKNILIQNKNQINLKTVIELIDYLKLELSNTQQESQATNKSQETPKEMLIPAKSNTNVYHPSKLEEVTYTQLDNKIELAPRPKLTPQEQESIQNKLASLKCDSATNLLDAYSFYELIESFEKQKKNYALLGLGVNRYNEFTQIYGKESSIKILITLGKLLKQYSTLDDIIARFDNPAKKTQFLICLLNGNENDVKNLTQSITQRVKKSIFMYKDTRLQIDLIFDNIQKISHSNIKEMLKQTLGSQTEIARGGVLDEPY